MAERPVTHHQQQHLHEAPVGCAALDLGDGKLDILRRHQDRGAKPRLTIEQLVRNPGH